MALSVHVPKEITDYKERIVGDFSGRQLISLAATGTILGLSYVILVMLLHVSMDVYPYLAAVICVPGLAIGFYRKDNMPCEQYFKLLWRHYMTNQKLSWSVEYDFPLTDEIESEEKHVLQKRKKRKKDEPEVRTEKKKRPKAARKRIQREIKKAKKEYRAAKRAAKAKN